MARVFVFSLACAAFSARAFLINIPIPEVVTELVNDLSGHYLLTASPAEELALLDGGQGPGWRRTGYRFTSSLLTPERVPAAGTVPACRFRAPSSGSTFYTVDAAECQALKDPRSGWLYEGSPFHAVASVAGTCQAGLPVYRLYNNRWMYGDSNHRFTPDERVRRRLIAAGWIDEGVAFCAADAGRSIETSFTVLTADAAPRERCDVPTYAGGSCLVMRNLPAPVRFVDRNINPYNPYEVNPAYSASWDALTGWSQWWGRLFTADATMDPVAVARSTFLQVVPVGAYSWATGIGSFFLHLDSSERRGGELASVSLERRFASTVLPGVPDARLTPWAGDRDRDLFVGMEVTPPATLRRTDRAGHVYALPMVKLRDMASGHAVVVTLQAFGTVAPGDFVAREPSGDVIVSTVFRADPSFGTRILGDFVACTADGSGGACGMQQARLFRFRIGFDEFRDLLRLARGIDAALSSHPASYRLEKLECRVESYRDVEVGLGLGGCALELTY